MRAKGCRSLFELAALQGDEESILRVAENYRQEGNREKMLEWLNPILAENRKARYMVIYDHLMHEEWLKAIDWLKKLTPAEQDMMIRIYRGSIYHTMKNKRLYSKFPKNQDQIYVNTYFWNSIVRHRYFYYERTRK